MIKERLRQEALARLSRLDRAEKAQMDRGLMDAFCALPSYKEANVVATYLSMDEEIDTSVLLAQAQKDGKRLVVPKVVGEGQMVFVDYDPDDLVLSYFGVWEPASSVAVAKEEIDLIHVPGVVFNEQGYRIGHGGGYYDRYLADYHGATVSTIYACQEGEFEPESHDIAVEEVLVGGKIERIC